MDDLIRFVTECLDVDEERAKRAASVAGPDWYYGPGATGDGRSTVYVLSNGGSPLADMLSRDDEEIAQLVANFDPARVLREVAAKRAILRRCAAHMNEPDQWPNGLVSPRAVVCRQTLIDLAAVWSDHSGYQQEWA